MTPNDQTEAHATPENPADCAAQPGGVSPPVPCSAVSEPPVANSANLDWICSVTTYPNEDEITLSFKGSSNEIATRNIKIDQIRDLKEICERAIQRHESRAEFLASCA